MLHLRGRNTSWRLTHLSWNTLYISRFCCFRVCSGGKPLQQHQHGIWPTLPINPLVICLSLLLKKIKKKPNFFLNTWCEVNITKYVQLKFWCGCHDFIKLYMRSCTGLINVIKHSCIEHFYDWYYEFTPMEKRFEITIIKVANFDMFIFLHGTF